MLTKKERSNVIKSIEDMRFDVMMQQVETNLKKHGGLLSEEILEALLRDKDLLRSLIVYHRTTFIALYDRFGKGKEKFLHFQVSNVVFFFLSR